MSAAASEVHLSVEDLALIKSEAARARDLLAGAIAHLAHAGQPVAVDLMASAHACIDTVLDLVGRTS